MNIVQVTADILSWVENFVEKPHPALGGWPPCPYARSARLKGTVAVYLGIDPYFDLKNFNRRVLGNREVVIYAYDPAEWNYQLFHTSLTQANTEFLLSNDLIALEDHPAEPEMVNGVCMNQGRYALAMCQRLSDLNIKAQQLADKDFYHGWPEPYLQELFQHRRDPRS